MTKPGPSSSTSINSYWKANLSITFKILIVWFSISFGCGIIFKEELDQFSIGGAPLGFWMAQQGSIIGFVILLIIYSFLMNKLDQKHGYEEEGK
jgi:putative solute:sodium symporter small subunit